MGRKPSVAWIFWVRNFGFTSKRKYGFLHSTWEVIIARRTGTTHSILDYVVYRLFYVLILVAFTVYRLSQVNPFPFLVYFETWAIFAHAVYAFVFLRQVLVHNHHRKALGRRQRMPDQLVITDEIEKDGHKYYISKKISVLPREVLSPYEKLVWVFFNVSATMSLVCLVASRLLERKHPLGRKGPPRDEHSSLVLLSVVMISIDVVVNTLPARFGHFIYSWLFCLVYFLAAYLYDTTRGKKAIHLYKDDIWNLFTNLKILGLVLPCHVGVVALAELRDFVVSLLDRSRTAVNQQKVRTQKRLARRKLMVPIYGPDGQIDRIILEHGTGVDEDWVYWRDEGRNTDWDGSSEDAEQPGGKLDEVKVEEGKGKIRKKMVKKKIKNLPKKIKIVKEKEEVPKRYGPPPDVTATVDEKPVVKRVKKKIEDVRLPSPPKGGAGKVGPKEGVKNAGAPPKPGEEPPSKLPKLVQPLKPEQTPKIVPTHNLPKKAVETENPEKEDAKKAVDVKPPVAPKKVKVPKRQPQEETKSVEPLKVAEPQEKEDTSNLGDVTSPPKKDTKKRKKKVKKIPPSEEKDVSKPDKLPPPSDFVPEEPPSKPSSLPKPTKIIPPKPNFRTGKVTPPKAEPVSKPVALPKPAKLPSPKAKETPPKPEWNSRQPPPPKPEVSPPPKPEEAPKPVKLPPPKEAPTKPEWNSRSRPPSPKPEEPPPPKPSQLPKPVKFPPAKETPPKSTPIPKPSSLPPKLDQAPEESRTSTQTLPHYATPLTKSALKHQPSATPTKPGSLSHSEHPHSEPKATLVPSSEPVHHYQMPITKKSHIASKHPHISEELMAKLAKPVHAPLPAPTETGPLPHYMLPIPGKSKSKPFDPKSHTPSKAEGGGDLKPPVQKSGQIPFIVEPPPKRASKQKSRARSPPTPPNKKEPSKDKLSEDKLSKEKSGQNLAKAGKMETPPGDGDLGKNNKSKENLTASKSAEKVEQDKVGPDGQKRKSRRKSGIPGPRRASQPARSVGNLTKFPSQGPQEQKSKSKKTWK